MLPVFMFHNGDLDKEFDPLGVTIRSTADAITNYACSNHAAMREYFKDQMMIYEEEFGLYIAHLATATSLNASNVYLDARSAYQRMCEQYKEWFSNGSRANEQPTSEPIFNICESVIGNNLLGLAAVEFDKGMAILAGALKGNGLDFFLDAHGRWVFASVYCARVSNEFVKKYKTSDIVETPGQLKSMYENNNNNPMDQDKRRYDSFDSDNENDNSKKRRVNKLLTQEYVSVSEGKHTIHHNLIKELINAVVEVNEYDNALEMRKINTWLDQFDKSGEKDDHRRWVSNGMHVLSKMNVDLKNNKHPESEKLSSALNRCFTKITIALRDN